MKSDPTNISDRKKEHLDLVLNRFVNFEKKTNGFESYDFIHYALTEVDINKIDLSIKFLGKRISYPFLISSMTGGTNYANDINAQLAIMANELNIPIGVGSQRQSLVNNRHQYSFKIIRKNAPKVPVLANIGAAQVVEYTGIDNYKKIIDDVSANGLIIHLNPLQELLQVNGQTNFNGLLNKISDLCEKLPVPVLVKEVGAGISKKAAKKLLDVGVKAIDIAGAGGTSWAGIELMRNSQKSNNSFWDWGLPASYCIKTVKQLKKKYGFTLIASGGISNGFDIAKALALGADITASAKTVLKFLDKKGIDKTIQLIIDWHETLKKIMFLTGAQNLKQLNHKKLIKVNKLY